MERAPQNRSDWRRPRVRGNAINGWTFTNGGQTVTFERSGKTGPATVVRIDSGGGPFVLRRQSD